MSAKTDSDRPPRIAVIGGGISGLAAAHRLLELAAAAQRRIDIRLFEASDRLGGVIATEPDGDVLLEHGPDSFLSEKPWGVGLCERLGLTDELIGTREDLRRTYVVHAGQLHPLPEGFLLLAPTRFAPLLGSRLFTWPAKIRMGLDLLLPRRPAGDETLQSFVTRRFGRQVLERVAQPLVGGIYTADPAHLSLAATMPRFLDMERQHRSVILAMWRQQQAAQAKPGVSGARWSLFLSFKRGMQTLIDELAKRMPEGLLRLGSAATTLGRDARGHWTLGMDDPWDAVIVATPAHVSARLLANLAAPLAAELAAIPYASTAIVNLVYRRDDIPHPLNGFGFVVPAIEQRNILACTFSSLKYEGRAPADLVIIRVFVGGALQPHLLQQDDAAMEASVRNELRSLLAISAEPRLRRIARYESSMPQYHIGHVERRTRIAQHVAAFPGLALAGNAYNGVGIPDCVHSGEQAAEAVFAAVSGQP